MSSSVHTTYFYAAMKPSAKNFVLYRLYCFLVESFDFDSTPVKLFCVLGTDHYFSGGGGGGDEKS